MTNTDIEKNMQVFRRDVRLRKDGLIPDEIQFFYEPPSIGCACGDCVHFIPSKKPHKVKPEGWCCPVRVYSATGKCAVGLTAKDADAVHQCEKFELRKIKKR